MQEPAHNVVEHTVRREGAVAGLVAENPDARQHQALGIAVGNPSTGTQQRVLDGGNVGQGSPAERKSHGVVTDDIGHGVGRRGLEAVSGDCITDGLDVGELLRRIGGREGLLLAAHRACPATGLSRRDGGGYGRHGGVCIGKDGRIVEYGIRWSEEEERRRRKEKGKSKDSKTHFWNWSTEYTALYFLFPTEPPVLPKLKRFSCAFWGSFSCPLPSKTDPTTGQGNKREEKGAEKE